MSFDVGGGQMGLSFGFDFDAASVTAVERAITDVASMTDRLALSEANLGRSVQLTQQQWMTASQVMQQYSQSLQQTTQQQQQFQQTSQQTISILSGAGTEFQQATQQTTNYSGALQSLGQQIPRVNAGLNEHNTLQENLAGTTQTSFEKIQQLGQGFGIAAASITGLIFSSYSLQRAQFQVHRIETQLELARNKLDDQTRKLSATTQKYGADSEQVAAIQADMAIQQNKITNLQERANLVQENYDHQLLAFATTTGPLVISTVSSLSQGITSMGEVLNITRQNVMNFIGAWGGVIGLGAIVATFAVGVVNAMLKIQKANDDMATAIKRSDWDTALLAKLEGLKVKTEDPFGFIVESLKSSFLGTGTGKGGIAEFQLNDLQKKLATQLVGFRSDINDFMKSPEWAQAFQFSSNVTNGIQADVKVIQDKILGMTKNLLNNVKLDPQYIDKFEQDLTTRIKNLKTKVAQLSEEFQTALTNKDVAKVSQFIFPDDATMKANEKQFEDNLFVANIAFQKFKELQSQGYKGSIDDFIAMRTNLTKEQADLLKDEVKNDNDRLAARSAFTDKYVALIADQGTRVKAQVEENAKLIAEAQKKFEEQQLASLTTSGRNDILKAKLTGEGNLASFLGGGILNTLGNAKNVAPFITPSGEPPAPKSLADLKSEMAGRQEAFKSAEDAAKALNDMNEAYLKLPPSIAKAIGLEKQYSLTTQILGKDVTVYDQALINREYLEKQVAIAATNANVVQGESAGVIAQLASQSIDLVSKQQELHDQVVANNILWIEMSDAMKQAVFGLQEITYESINVTEALTEVSKMQYLFNKGSIDGKLAARDFADSLVYEEAKRQALHEGLLETVDLLNLRLPEGIQATDEELMAAGHEFMQFGDTARTTTTILNRVFSETRGFVSDLVKAAAEGGKQWKDAWKDVPKEFIPKSLRDNAKAFIEDQADIIQAGEKMKASLGLFQNMLEFGQLSGKQITKWTGDLKLGMKGINSELDDLVGKDIRHLLTDPLMDLFKNGLTTEEVNTLSAWVNEYIRLAADGLSPQDIQQLKDSADNISLIGDSADKSTDKVKKFTAAYSDMKSTTDVIKGFKKTGRLDTGTDIDIIASHTPGFSKAIYDADGNLLRDANGVIQPKVQKKGEQVKDIQKMASDIAVALQKVQTAGANMATQVSNSMSILVKNMKPHVTTVLTYSQSMQTALANFANQGSNSMALFVQNIRPHVVTIATYFGTTIVQAINAASKQLVAFAALAKIVGGGGTGGGGGGFQNVQFFANPGVSGAIGAGVGFASDSLTRFLQSLGIKMPGGMDKGLIQNPFRGDDKQTKGGGGSDAVAGMKAVEVEAQKLQTALANLANQGSNSMGILAKNSSFTMNGMKKNLSVGEVASQGLQTGLANLSNEGSNSLSALAKSSSTNMNGIKKNFSVGEVAAQKLQTGLANLDNEGVKSLKELAHWSSTTMNGFKNNMQVGIKAVDSLKSAINSLKSKTVTVKVVVSQSEGGVWHMAKGGLLNITSAQNGEIIETNGPTMIPIVAGDNPGGHEIAAFIPMNNPVPTLKRLAKVFGARQSSIGKGSVGGGPSDGGEGGVEVINLYMNEEKMMTWIRRKLLRNKQGA